MIYELTNAFVKTNLFVKIPDVQDVQDYFHLFILWMSLFYSRKDLMCRVRKEKRKKKKKRKMN